jgi:hypothetical protein
MTRNLSAVALLALAGLAVLSGGQAAAGASKDIPGAKADKPAPPYVHAVIFYLKKDAPEGEVEALIRDTHKLLAKIPTVRKLWVGRPAAKSTPKFAVTDYQVGLLVLFDNYEGLQAYLDHDLHTEYITRHGKYWDRVPVYDFANQTK